MNVDDYTYYGFLHFVNVYVASKGGGGGGGPVPYYVSLFEYVDAGHINSFKRYYFLF